MGRANCKQHIDSSQIGHAKKREGISAPPVFDQWVLKSSEHIFHFNRLARRASADDKGRRFELWRASDHRRIAGKAEALARDEHCHIQFVIGIFVMHQRRGVSAGRDAIEADGARIARRHACAVAFWIFAAIGEEFGVRGYADQNISFHIAKAGDADAERRGFRSSDASTSQHRQSGQAQYRCRKPCPKSESKAHNSPDMHRDVSGDA